MLQGEKMKMLGCFFFALSILAMAGTTFAQTDTMPLSDSVKTTWLYTDEYGSPAYSGIEIVDTSSNGPPYSVGIDVSGNSILRDDGYDTSATIMNYFDYKYQFTAGWAGFKLMWEDRDWSWDVRGYDSLIIKYIGPLAQHKVTVFLGESFDRYEPAFVDSVGVLPNNYAAIYGSAAWRTVALPIPQAPAGALRHYLREVRFIIHNTSGAALTSPEGFFALDKVGFKKADHHTDVPTTSTKKSGCGSGMGLAFLPAIWFKVRSGRNRKKKNQQKN
jgi:hypothetical protein